MKKILLLVGMLVLAQNLHAYPFDVGIYRSTEIKSGDSLQACALGNKQSTVAFVIVDYLVKSTGSYQTTLDIFDATESSLTARKSWTGFPINALTSNIWLGIETTTGALVCINGAVAQGTAKVQIRYYIKTKQ